MNLIQNVEISKLYEVYGETLTDKQRQIVDLYVINDLTLAEVSNILNISRTAVKYALDNAVNSMSKLDEKLKILSKREAFKNKLSEISNNSHEEAVKTKLNSIIEEI